MDSKQIAVLAVIIAVSFAGGFAVATVANNGNTEDGHEPISYAIVNTGDFYTGDVKFSVSFLSEEYGYMVAMLDNIIVPLGNDLRQVYVPGPNSFDFSVDHTKYGYKSKADFLNDIEFTFNGETGIRFMDLYPK